ncbi:myogenesis-regulating glycosidase-like isoform X1 [Plutella xylostella]|uniref:myogenesis-regulating glycosidase-like isoform X1 n=1 Tax=Plutella xylostella TaxID=51655 RepID=UPI002032B4DC|nr:myogenesis-regulating glycosidase-like isoform X1 [Plutella xylostella]
MGSFVLLLAALLAASHAQLSAQGGSMVLKLEPQLAGGFYLTIQKDANSEAELLGHIGTTLPSTYTEVAVDEGIALDIGDSTRLTVNTWYDEEAAAHGVRISWNTSATIKLEDCIRFGSKHWYAGPMQFDQVFPIENAQQTYAPYVSKEKDNGAVLERYWLNSAGEYFYVHPQVPLFIDYNNNMANHMCFGAQIASPYSAKRTHTELAYDIWFLGDAKKAHMHAVFNYLGKPSGLPDYRMVQYPIWSTWVEYERDIDEVNVMEFANKIVENNFTNSQFEVDDLWEVCYGSLTVDERKFSNFSKTVADLKALGFRVTIWAHPFINKDCEPWYSEALNNNYLVLNEAGSPDTSWWNNNGSVPAYIDFTNPAAAEWWASRLRTLQQTYDIDSFKFDAGESSFSPQVPVQTGDVYLHPHHIVNDYVRTCVKFGDMVEVRAGFRTQELPIFVRMVDRDSVFGTNNGLHTVITTTLTMNLAGYTLVLPDMIGGNGNNLNNSESGPPTKELYIRWVEANTFLPAMQYSVVPWSFDEETVNISRRYTELHARYADVVYAAMNASVQRGTPVNAPLWWLDPSDATAQGIGDQYVLGEDIIVAPIMTQGQKARDVYLPVGKWLDQGDPNTMHEGPIWIRDYPAPLDTLPYFVRQHEPGAANAPFVSALLVLLAMVACLVY